MPKKLERALSPRQVATVKPGMYADGGGLYLQVTVAKDGTSLNCSWVFRYRTNGTAGSRLRDMGLGPVSTLSLSEAREKARQLRQKRLDGIDPIEERRADRAKLAAAAGELLTFDRAAQQFLAERENMWKSAAHREQWRRTLRIFASPTMGKLAVQAIETRHVTEVLDPIWRSKPPTASRLRGRIEFILDWAKVRGHRKGENPARWKGHLDHVYELTLKAQKALHRQAGKSGHHPALPYTEIAQFMTKLRSRSGSAAKALEFTILTASRTGEALRATWDEVDFSAKTWTIPGARMKTGQEHRVPLSDRALAILNEQAAIRENEYLFPGELQGKPLNQFTLLWVAKHLKPGTTVHGFRSTFRDWAAEQTNFAREIAEKALAHAVGDETERAYQRSDLFDKRRQLMAAWGRYCTSTPIATGSVTPIRGSAS